MAKGNALPPFPACHPTTSGTESGHAFEGRRRPARGLVAEMGEGSDGESSLGLGSMEVGKAGRASDGRV